MGVLGDMVRRSSSDVVRKEDEDARDLETAVRKRLHKGIVHFIYRKKRSKKAAPGSLGEIRDAWGTLNFDHVPSGVNIPSVMGKWYSGQWTYMDIESEGWRVAYELLGAESYIFTTEEYEKLTKADKMARFIKLAKKLGIEDEIRPTATSDESAESPTV